MDTVVSRKYDKPVNLLVVTTSRPMLEVLSQIKYANSEGGAITFSHIPRLIFQTVEELQDSPEQLKLFLELITDEEMMAYIDLLPIPPEEFGKLS